MKTDRPSLNRGWTIGIPGVDPSLIRWIRFADRNSGRVQVRIDISALPTIEKMYMCGQSGVQFTMSLSLTNEDGNTIFTMLSNDAIVVDYKLPVFVKTGRMVRHFEVTIRYFSVKFVESSQTNTTKA